MPSRRAAGADGARRARTVRAQARAAVFALQGLRSRVRPLGFVQHQRSPESAENLMLSRRSAEILLLSERQRRGQPVGRVDRGGPRQRAR